VGEHVLPVISDIEIAEAIIVVIADADALSPAGASEAGFFGDVGKSAVVIVAVEMICECGCSRDRCGIEGRAVDNENVRPPAPVVIENGDTGTCGLDDVFFLCTRRRRCSSS
jgi:hypothetical protein